MADRKTKKQTRPIRKDTKRKKSSSSGWLSFFRFGESYSSLLLGIVVVIITTVLLVFLVRDRNVSQVNNPQRSISSTNTGIDNSQNIEENISPTNSQVSITATSTVKPTLKVSPTLTPTPVVKATSKPTVTVTKAPTVTSVLPTKAVATPTVVTQDKNTKSHTVVSGDNLWSIAEKYYKSGYNWVDIQRANNLSNPGIIKVGMKLTIPNVPAKQATVTTSETSTATVYGPVITGTTYKVQKGDHLWGISVRAFNDGHKWVEIARVNNITSPSVIQPGLVLKIPRTATPTPTPN